MCQQNLLADLNVASLTLDTQGLSETKKSQEGHMSGIAT